MNDECFSVDRLIEEINGIIVKNRDLFSNNEILILENVLSLLKDSASDNQILTKNKLISILEKVSLTLLKFFLESNDSNWINKIN
ncbi:MAG: hypothetical protein H8E14_08850 [Candidatus Marinimicrobia bacterium]|nr:hypothetical protein [Candidatus Neomarinimicrobiota bacterium]